ncbi:MAG: mechanosensitive ion channel domain-containing protein [Nitrososphaeria archaeon]
MSSANQNVKESTQSATTPAVLRAGYVRALTRLIVYIVIYALVMAAIQWLIINIIPGLKPYQTYVNVGLTLVFGYLIVMAFADTIYHFMRIKYPHDVARAFRNVFLLIGIGALITAIAGAIGGGLAGVSVGGFLGIVIGFATQQVMGQAVAGVFLLITRPFRINDHVNIVGEEGIVEDVGILFTVVKKMDGTTTVLIPSSAIIGSKIYLLPPVQPQQQQQKQ